MHLRTRRQTLEKVGVTSQYWSFIDNYAEFEEIFYCIITNDLVHLCLFLKVIKTTINVRIEKRKYKKTKTFEAY